MTQLMDEKDVEKEKDDVPQLTSLFHKTPIKPKKVKWYDKNEGKYNLMPK